MTAETKIIWTPKGYYFCILIKRVTVMSVSRYRTPKQAKKALDNFCEALGVTYEEE